MRWLDWLRGCFDSDERARRRLRRAIAGARWESRQATIRPFSDKYDDSGGGGGYFAAAGHQHDWQRGQGFVLKPVPPHPRSTARRTPEEKP